MNRKERRRLERKIGKEARSRENTVGNTPLFAHQAPPALNFHDTYNLINYAPTTRLHVPIDVTRGEGRKINNNITVCMLGLPGYVLIHDYHYTDEKVSDILDDITDYYDSLFKDYFDFDDVDQVLSEEANLVIDEVAKSAGISKAHQDQTFLIVIGTAIMTMIDKHGFDNEQLKEFTEKLIYRYTLYKREFITNYELIQMLRKHAGINMIKE